MRRWDYVREYTATVPTLRTADDLRRLMSALRRAGRHELADALQAQGAVELPVSASGLLRAITIECTGESDFERGEDSGL